MQRIDLNILLIIVFLTVVVNINNMHKLMYAKVLCTYPWNNEFCIAVNACAEAVIYVLWSLVCTSGVARKRRWVVDFGFEPRFEIFFTTGWLTYHTSRLTDCMHIYWTVLVLANSITSWFDKFITSFDNFLTS